jgi:glyoxylase-like metal-dependent hydrolase (beta-lactamase superfamily II)
VTIPSWQVKEYNEDFYILRQSGCINPEKPFLFLIFGENKALLEDTGVGTLMPDNTRGTVIPTAPVIMDLMAKWAASKKHAPLSSLVVIHSHGHNDHTAADEQFQALPNVEFIAAKPDAISKALGIKWPTEIGHIDLGGRVVDVIPFPGHQEASIALYDRKTGNLMGGDSLYPGLLTVEDIDLFTASSQRLTDFVSDHLVAHVFGTHIEQKNLPYLDFGRGTIYQIDEAPLELTRAHVFELNDAFVQMHGENKVVAMPDFTLVPRGKSDETAYPPELRRKTN